MTPTSPPARKHHHEARKASSSSVHAAACQRGSKCRSSVDPKPRGSAQHARRRRRRSPPRICRFAAVPKSRATTIFSCATQTMTMTFGKSRRSTFCRTLRSGKLCLLNMASSPSFSCAKQPCLIEIPCSGRELILNAHGELTDRIENGSFLHIQVKLAGTRIINKKFDLCASLQQFGQQCPFRVGNVSISKELMIDKMIPRVSTHL